MRLSALTANWRKNIIRIEIKAINPPNNGLKRSTPLMRFSRISRNASNMISSDLVPLKEEGKVSRGEVFREEADLGILAKDLRIFLKHFLEEAAVAEKQLNISEGMIAKL